MADMGADEAERFKELITVAIPNGRKALLDSHKNLEELAVYCEDNYDSAESPQEKSNALEDSKQYAIQSLASVAYMVNGMATHVLELFNHQYVQLSSLESTIHNIKQNIDIHKEKVARREIGLMAAAKRNSRVHRITVPNELEQGRMYQRSPYDLSALDSIGHGVRAEGNLGAHQTKTRMRQGSVRSTSPGRSAMHQSFTTNAPFSHVDNPRFVASPVVPGSSPSRSGSISSGVCSSSTFPPTLPPPNTNSSAPLPPTGMPPPPSAPAPPPVSASPVKPPGPPTSGPPKPRTPSSSMPPPPLNMPPPPGATGPAPPSMPRTPPPDMAMPPMDFPPVDMPPPPNFSPGPVPPPLDAQSMMNTNANVPPPPLLGGPPGAPPSLPPSVPNSPPEVHHVSSRPPPLPSDCMMPPPPPLTEADEDVYLEYTPEDAIRKPPSRSPSKKGSTLGRSAEDKASRRRSQAELPPPGPPPDEPPPRPPSPVDDYDYAAEDPAWAPPQYVEKVKTLYAYEAGRHDELSFDENVTIYVTRKNADGWYHGVMEPGASGVFPGNYVEAEDLTQM